jgi:selenocysteine lyase/cysteine desulfurase
MSVTALATRRLEHQLERIRTAVIGDDAVLAGPFGPRRLAYADWTASGRSLAFIENVIRDAVLPLYANTHTEASATGRWTTHLREDARAAVHRAVGGGADDVVVFCGSGATDAVDRLMRVLELHSRPRPVVFVGPFEHHSNELPWRESSADVVVIREDADGLLDLDHLREELARHAARPLKIGSFSAASNVTGIVTDVDAVSILLHRFGGLACWDYAAAAPHLPLDMNPLPDVEDGELAYKDAVFISPHKLPGGPGTPGILVAKRHRFANEIPAVPGGGTILYVTPERQTYLPDPVQREEGGTPAIVESIRAGLAFRLHEAVGAEAVQELEEAFVRRALSSWRENPRLLLLGNPDLPRVPIVSFGVRHPLEAHPAGMLHPNFVVALLNDLFGIQARSGCFCAGPYVHRLVGFDLEISAAHEAEAARGNLGIKLGFVRLFRLLHQRDGLRPSRRRCQLRRRPRLEAAPALPLRPELWAMAPPLRAPAAAGRARRPHADPRTESARVSVAGLPRRGTPDRHGARGCARAPPGAAPHLGGVRAPALVPASVVARKAASRGGPARPPRPRPSSGAPCRPGARAASTASRA